MRKRGWTAAVKNGAVIAALGLVALVAPGRVRAQASEAPYSLVAKHWANAWSHKQAAAAVALYAADAEFFHATGQRVQGRPAIAALFSQVLARNTPSIEMTSVSGAQAGPVAWDSGTYRETITPMAGGAAKSLHGCYLLVLEKDPGGEWLIKSQLWSEAD